MTRNYALGSRAFQSTIGYPEVLPSLHMKDIAYKTITNGEPYKNVKEERENIFRYMSIQ